MEMVKCICNYSTFKFFSAPASWVRERGDAFEIRGESQAEKQAHTYSIMKINLMHSFVMRRRRVYKKTKYLLL